MDSIADFLLTELFFLLVLLFIVAKSNNSLEKERREIRKRLRQQ